MWIDHACGWFSEVESRMVYMEGHNRTGEQ